MIVSCPILTMSPVGDELTEIDGLTLPMFPSIDERSTPKEDMGAKTALLPDRLAAKSDCSDDVPNAPVDVPAYIGSDANIAAELGLIAASTWS